MARHGHVAQVAALDDLGGEAAGGAVVGEADEELGHAAVLHRLRARRAVAAGQARHLHRRVAVLSEAGKVGPVRTTQSKNSEFYT